MKNILLILIINSLLPSKCNIDNKRKEIYEDNISQGGINKNDDFVFDTSINGQLFLMDPSSIEQTLGNIMPMMDSNADFPNVYFSNNTKDNYLKMIFFPGDVANSISQFEVGLKELIPSDMDAIPFPLDSIYTESKIVLGMTKSQITGIRGTGYEEIVVGEFTLIRYVIDDCNFMFLKRYNMPIYIVEYWIQNDRLLKYRFGFEYP